MEQSPQVLTGGQLSVPIPPWQAESSRKSFTRAREVTQIEDMLEKDAVARQAATFLASVVVGLIGEYTHPDERIQQFVRTALAGMRGDWTATQRWLLRAPVVGFALSEKIWKRGRVDGREAWTFDALAPIVPQSVAHGGIEMDTATGQPSKVTQWGQYGSGVVIPGEKCAHWAYDDTGSGYGTPLGRGMLPLYEGRVTADRYWLTGLKRMAQPLIYELVPDGQAQVTGEGQKPLVEVYSDAWATTEGGSAVLRPVTMEWADHKLPQVQVLDTTGFDQAFERYVDHVHRLYYMALGIPALAQMESQYGTRAQSVVHMDAARFCALPLAMQFSEECLVRDLVQPLVDVNFGEQDDYGSFPCTIPLNEEWLAGLLQSLASAGVLGMMLDYRVYAKVQALLPEILPEVEEGDYYTEPTTPEPTQPSLPAEPPEEMPR